MAKNKPQRELVVHPEFLEDFRYWIQTDRRLALRVIELIEDTLRDPFQGLGKPEPLKYQLSGAWSRRITTRSQVSGFAPPFLKGGWEGFRSTGNPPRSPFSKGGRRHSQEAGLKFGVHGWKT